MVLVTSDYCISKTLRSPGQHPRRDALTMFLEDQSGNSVMRGMEGLRLQGGILGH